ncbi:pimeloyl-ACP methyl ester carboxylesterase [Catenuloplanes nepalensis]|uniref:Pimeloyl-ACP methyl ester carboxylesterase n=1 Tax=Catenuloplanes nepalensis TaxID=587533 RepID=A0ABT9N7X4_9ACTN|nr:alpha/beta hydrolase [Catenuloplanes nepalensis]MDP9799501.1 pimeloyl-ACP methyl ester carboxylesterase [Catenuloplanes nepalensis]
MPTSPLRASLLAAALPVVLALAACSPPAESAPAGPPAELQRFYDQKLAFGSCDGYATSDADRELFAGNPAFQCARLEVPLNYDEPDGDTAKIAMLRVPARGESLGPLVLHAGGPGVPGMNFAATTAAALATSPVTERFDLIGFDTRGVGATTPAASCFTEEDYADPNAAFEFIVTDKKATAEDTRKIAEKCTTRSGGAKNLGALSSRDTARDMDIMRAALGQEKLNFFGHSYGTRIGALYAREFPRNVRAMVVDSAVDPHLAFADRRVASFAAFQKAFDAMAADCAAKPDCGLGQDPAAATRVYQEAVQPLATTPLTGSDGRKLSFRMVVDFTISALYDPIAWPFVTGGIGDVRKGNADTMLAIIDRLNSGSGATDNYLAASVTINCMDEERLTPEQAVEMRARLWQTAPFLDSGQGTDGARDTCEAWPVPAKPAHPFPERIEGLPPTLTISITNDTTTPHSGGISLAKTLGGSLLTADGWGHTIAASGKNPCINAAFADYLINLRTPAEGATCKLEPTTAK